MLPLRGQDDGPGKYDLRLIFGSVAGDKPGQRVFDVRVQGELACAGVDVVGKSVGEAGFLAREVKGVTVSDKLVIDRCSSSDKPTPLQMPILSGLEVDKSDP